MRVNIYKEDLEKEVDFIVFIDSNISNHIKIANYMMDKLPYILKRLGIDVIDKPVSRD